MRNPADSAIFDKGGRKKDVSIVRKLVILRFPESDAGPEFLGKGVLKNGRRRLPFSRRLAARSAFSRFQLPAGAFFAEFH